MWIYIYTYIPNKWHRNFIYIYEKINFNTIFTPYTQKKFKPELGPKQKKKKKEN